MCLSPLLSRDKLAALPAKLISFAGAQHRPTNRPSAMRSTNLHTIAHCKSAPDNDSGQSGPGRKSSNRITSLYIQTTLWHYRRTTTRTQQVHISLNTTQLYAAPHNPEMIFSDTCIQQSIFASTWSFFKFSSSSRRDLCCKVGCSYTLLLPHSYFFNI